MHWLGFILYDAFDKKLKTEDKIDGVEELLSAGKDSHDTVWLIGRHDAKPVKKSTNPAPTDSYY